MLPGEAGSTLLGTQGKLGTQGNPEGGTQGGTQRGEPRGEPRDSPHVFRFPQKPSAHRAGQIIERGTHESLFAARGRYYDLYTRQHGLEMNLFLAPGEGDTVPEPAKAITGQTHFPIPNCVCPLLVQFYGATIKPGQEKTGQPDLLP